MILAEISRRARALRQTSAAASRVGPKIGRPERL